MLREQPRVVPSKYNLRKDKTPTERILNIFLSDLHFGSLLSGRRTPLKYGPLQESRRLAAVAQQVCEYKLQYRDVTELHVYIAGDIFQGQLHDPRDGAPLRQQFGASLYYLKQFVAFVSQHFKRVKVHCTPGNHGRNTSRHKDRATLEKTDSFENMLYDAVKVGCDSLPNVQFFIPEPPYIAVNAFDKRIFATHGDTVLNVGYPGSAINVKSLETQINKINAALPDRQEYNLFVVGHVHVNSCVTLSNGATVITNGCLIPTDEYALSIGLFESTCGQVMWESVPGHVVGDYRYIQVDSNTDKDAALNKIIRPFEGYGV
jgi:UDP-2,3-diacylglucosamine pyrophosphatase LpxH